MIHVPVSIIIPVLKKPSLIDLPSYIFAQLAGAVEYTDCFSAEGKKTPDECLTYDIKQSDGEASILLEIWRMWCTPLLPSFPGPPWPGVVAPILC